MISECLVLIMKLTIVSGNNIEMCGIEIENDEILRTIINIAEILDGQTQNTQNTNDVLDIKLPKHQRCAVHTGLPLRHFSYFLSLF